MLVQIASGAEEDFFLALEEGAFFLAPEGVLDDGMVVYCSSSGLDSGGDG